jgi:hypothetical protein
MLKMGVVTASAVIHAMPGMASGRNGTRLANASYSLIRSSSPHSWTGHCLIASRRTECRPRDTRTRRSPKTASVLASYPDQFLVFDYVTRPAVVVDEMPDAKPYMVYEAAGVPGNSGFAVVNVRGELVSILQIG